MAWQLPHHEVRAFARNPLAVVVAQLRFQPILKVPASIAAFQDLVRGRFPGFEVAEVQNVALNAMGAVHVSQERAFICRSSDSVALSVSATALSIEYSVHRSRTVLLEDVELALHAMTSVYAPVVPMRFGLRYVNVISRTRISRDLERLVEWEDLLTDTFARVPVLASSDDATAFAAEISAPASPGHMVVRYGKFVEQGAQEPVFRLDTDRFVEGPVAVGEAGRVLEGFSSDIFQVFMSAAGASLLEWMSTEATARA